MIQLSEQKATAEETAAEAKRAEDKILRGMYLVCMTDITTKLLLASFSL